MDEARSAVRRAVIAGRDAWVVEVVEALSRDQPAWLQEEVDGWPVPHFVDARTGAVFGYDARSPVFFDAADRTRYENQVLDAQRGSATVGKVTRR